MSPEREPQPRREVELLRRIGREDCIEQGAPGYTGVYGGNFLDAYDAHGKPEAKQGTADMIDGFLGMRPADPDYADALAMMNSYVTAFFGEAPQA